MKEKNTRIAFFGGEPLAVPTLEILLHHGIVPACIVANPDRKSGRKMEVTPPPVKVWALTHGVRLFQPESLKDETAEETLKNEPWDLFVVVAYGSIIPEAVLGIPKHGVINLHPSLLPELRGPSPIRSAILADIRETGVTVMKMDAQMDHGPILAQEKISIREDAWPMRGRELDERLAEAGAELLARTIPKWLAGEITPLEQEHENATFTKKLTKDMGELDPSDDPYKNLLKIRAFDGWPGTYFFMEKDGKRVRVKITDAELDTDGTLKIIRVIPEGRREMEYSAFIKEI